MTTMPADRVVGRGGVIQVALPADARALSSLSRVDYSDAFIVDAGGGELSAEQWTQAVFTDAPLAVRARLVSGWLALGLKLGAPWSARRVLGWNVRHRSPSVVVLAAESLLGLHAELLFRTDPPGLLFATLVQQNNPAARAVWARVTSTHQRVVRSLLTHAARRQAPQADQGESNAQGRAAPTPR